MEKTEEPDLTCTLPNFIWSIEYHRNSVIIKYNYDRDFARCVKNTQILQWDKYIQGWIAHIDFSDVIYSTISDNFPEWKCIDKRPEYS